MREMVEESGMRRWEEGKSGREGWRTVRNERERENENKLSK